MNAETIQYCNFNRYARQGKESGDPTVPARGISGTSGQVVPVSGGPGVCTTGQVVPDRGGPGACATEQVVPVIGRLGACSLTAIYPVGATITVVPRVYNNALNGSGVSDLRWFRANTHCLHAG